MCAPQQFIAEMKNPKDFPKGWSDAVQTPRMLLTTLSALWAVTIAEVVVFTLCGAIVYHFVGGYSCRISVLRIANNGAFHLQEINT